MLIKFICVFGIILRMLFIRLFLVCRIEISVSFLFLSVGVCMVCNGVLMVVVVILSLCVIL